MTEHNDSRQFVRVADNNKHKHNERKVLIMLGNKAIINRVNKIKELENEVKGLQEMIDALKDELKADMTEKELSELEAGDYKLHYSKVSQNKFDTTSFKKEHASLYDQYVKLTEYMRFSIC